MLNELTMREPLDIEEKTRLTTAQFVAFKAACQELGIKRADVLRALILQFIRDHHTNTSLRSIGLRATDHRGLE